MIKKPRVEDPIEEPSCTYKKTHSPHPLAYTCGVTAASVEQEGSSIKVPTIMEIAAEKLRKASSLREAMCKTVTQEAEAKA